MIGVQIMIHGAMGNYGTRFCIDPVSRNCWVGAAQFPSDPKDKIVLCKQIFAFLYSVWGLGCSQRQKVVYGNTCT